MISRPVLTRARAEYFAFIKTVVAGLTPGGECLRGESSPSIATISSNGFTPEPDRLRHWIPDRRSSRRRKRQWLFTDEKYWALLPTYHSIRRHIWRHVVRDHRRCIIAMARHLWWNVEHEKTAPLCPVAYAFLQWRMFWEGFGAPRHLFECPHHPANRLLVWLSEGAPWCPREWPLTAQAWVTHRVFAFECLNTFDEWMRIARRQRHTETMNWSRRLSRGYGLTYWAVSTMRESNDALRLYFEARDGSWPCLLDQNARGKRHALWLDVGLAQVRR